MNADPESLSRKDPTLKKSLLPDNAWYTSPVSILENLCQRCIGRAYYGVIQIEGNATRGRAITFAYDILTGLERHAVEECQLCHGLLDDVYRYCDKIEQDLRGTEFSTFLVGSIMERSLLEFEGRVFETLSVTGESIKKDFNRELGKMLSERLVREVNFDDPDVMITVDLRYDQINYRLRPVYIYGTYMKLERGIPQTRWIHKDHSGKSVEELIGEPAMEAFSGTNFYLHGSGREDVDVRMLGNGREFVIEIESPRSRNADLKAIESRINASSKVEVHDLKFCDHATIERIKSAKNLKTYRSRISSIDPINEAKLYDSLRLLTGKIIYQRTPLRVASRRSDLIRQRTVKHSSLMSVNGREAVIEMTAESGTYIKELISGDSGRTEPSLSELYGSPLTVLELDVIGIQRGDE